MPSVKVGALVLRRSDKRAVLDVLDSNQLSPGPKVKQFEHEFSKAHGARYGLFVNSGTDALRIALAALKEVHEWKDGEGVLVPSVTFVATVNVILQVGLKPVFMDAGLDGFNLDRLRHFENCTKGDFFEMPKIRAIMPVHLCGKRLDLDGLKPFVKRYKLKVIEDSCESMGVGPIQGDVACYSTYVCHLITTGVGGLAITNHQKYADVMCSLANHGRDLKGMPGNGVRPWKTRFKFDRIGYSARATEVEAAIGLQQLKALPAMIKRRQAVAGMFIEGLERRWWNYLDLPISVDPSHAYMMFPVICKNGTNRDELCAHLEKNGIETRPLLPLINQPCYKNLGLNPDEFPTAKRYEKDAFYIGCHQNMTDKDVRHVIRMFEKYFLR